MWLVDTACRLDDPRFDDDRDLVMLRARSSGVTRLIVPSDEIATQRRRFLPGRFTGTHLTVGVGPDHADSWDTQGGETLRRAARRPGVVAIGDIGLDLTRRARSSFDGQVRALREQLAIAAELNLPVLLRHRKAGMELLEIVEDSPVAGRSYTGVLHEITADVDVVDRALELGFSIAVGPRITFPESRSLPRLVAGLPSDRIVLETGAPLVAPHPHRGSRNEPSYLRFVAAAVGRVRGISTVQAADLTTGNATRIFGFA